MYKEYRLLLYRNDANPRNTPYINNLEKIICSSDIYSKDVLAICVLA